MAINEVAKATIYLDDKQAEAAMKSLNTQMDKWAKSMNEAKKANDKAGFDKAKKEYNAANKALNSHKKTVVDVTKVLNNLSGSSYNQLMKAQRSLESSIRGMNKNTKEEIALYNQKVAQLKRVKEATSSARSEMGMFRKASTNVTAGLRSVAGALGITGGIYMVVNAFKSIINTSKEFEKSLSSLSAITGLTGKDLDFFKQQAIALSGQTMKSANEIVKAFELVGSIRPELLKDKEALSEVTKQAIILSEATGGKLGLEEAARATAGTLNQFGKASSEASEVINVLAAGSKFGAAAVVDITTAIDKFGAVADGANMSLEQTVGVIETLAEKSITGAEAGTKLRNIIIKLQADQSNYKDGVFDFNLALENLANANMDVTQLTQEFGKENVVAAQILVKSRQKVIDYTDAVTGTSTAIEQQKIQNDNLNGSLTKLGNSWDSFIIGINSSSGFLKSAIDLFGDMIENLSMANKSFGELIVMASDDVMRKALRQDKVEVEELSKSLQDKGVPAIEANKRAVNLLLLQYIKLKEEGVSDPELIQRQIDNLRSIGQAYEKIETDRKQAEEDRKKAELENQKIKEAAAKKAASVKSFDPTKLDSPDTSELEYQKFKASELQKYREEDLKAIEDKYNREKVLAETKYNEELLALGTDEEAKKALKTQFEADELQRNLDHLNALKTQMEQTVADVNLEDSMLTDEERDALLLKIEDLKLAISELKLASSSEDPDTVATGQLSKMLFGINGEDDLAAKIQKIGSFAVTTFGKINQIISNSEQRQLQEFETANDKKKAALEQRLNSGKMSQEQYNTAVSALDAEMEKKQRKMAHDQAVRSKAMAVMQAIVNTAAGVAAQLSIPGAGIGLAIAAAAMGAIEIAIAASTPVPALASGNRQKILADDGKTYNARIAPSNRTSGMVGEPTFIPGLGLVGETPTPELVFNPSDTQKIIDSPALIDAINMTLGSTPQFAQGNATEIIRENNTVTTTTMDDETKALLADIRAKLAEPSTAYLVADENYIRTHQKKVGEYDTFKNKVS